MDDLIVRSLMGRATEDEERALERWRFAAPENEAYYQALARTWRAVGAAESPAVRASAPPRAAAVIAAAERRAPVLELPSRRRRLLVPMAAAAAAVLAAVVTLDWLGSGPDAVEVRTAAGEMLTVRLPDGSHARLAPRTTLRYSAAEPRAAWLNGRAFFGITEDPQHPFRVRTPSGDAVVLGTRFDLAADTATLQLVVVEGRVALAAAAGRAEVGAGQVSRVVQGRPVVEPQQDVHALLGWLGDAFIFESTTLAEVASELERRYGRPVVVTGPELAAREVSAVFSDQTLAQIVDVVCRVTDATCVVGPDTIRITP